MGFGDLKQWDRLHSNAADSFISISMYFHSQKKHWSKEGLSELPVLSSGCCSKESGKVERDHKCKEEKKI